MKFVLPSLPGSFNVPSTFWLILYCLLWYSVWCLFCTCCNHCYLNRFISFTIICALLFFLIHWFHSLLSFVIPSKCLKNFICVPSKRCSSLFFNTQASLPIFIFALTEMLWIINSVSLFICIPNCLHIASAYIAIGRKYRVLYVMR